jgi:hypothetical protein
MEGVDLVHLSLRWCGRVPGLVWFGFPPLLSSLLCLPPMCRLWGFALSICFTSFRLFSAFTCRGWGIYILGRSETGCIFFSESVRSCLFLLLRAPRLQKRRPDPKRHGWGFSLARAGGYISLVGPKRAAFFSYSVRSCRFLLLRAPRLQKRGPDPKRDLLRNSNFKIQNS